jgi:hypothetical protein
MWQVETLRHRLDASLFKESFVRTMGDTNNQAEVHDLFHSGTTVTDDATSVREAEIKRDVRE